MMSGIRGVNTRPELFVRKALFARGFRYRIHARGLPGKPDIVLPRWKAAILVHGCFWHGHANCKLAKIPSTRIAFWESKLARNREVDLRTNAQLEEFGWRVLTIWECALRGTDRLVFEDMLSTVEGWIRGNRSSSEIRGCRNHEGGPMK